MILLFQALVPSRQNIVEFLNNGDELIFVLFFKRLLGQYSPAHRIFFVHLEIVTPLLFHQYIKLEV